MQLNKQQTIDQKNLQKKHNVKELNKLGNLE